MGGRLLSVAERLVVFDALEEVLERVARTALEAANGADAVAVHLFDRVAGSVSLVKALGLPRSCQDRPPLALGAGLPGRVVLTGMSVAVTDVTELAEEEAAVAAGMRAALCVPLRRNWGVLGAITVYRRSALPFSEDDRFLLSMYALQAAEALERVLEVESLRRQSTVDLLTGALNKAALWEAVRRQAKLAERHGVVTSVIFLDLDGFKQFNDRHGHLLGDKLLADFARLIRGNCRASDLLARFGGEEFVLLAPHTGKEGGVRLAEKLLRLVRSHPFQGREGPVTVTFSAGVACIPEDGLDPEEVLGKADRAMYAGKRAGRGRVTAWPVADAAGTPPAAAAPPAAGDHPGFADGEAAQIRVGQTRASSAE